MNKIIREHYPAAKLPSDLREGIDPNSTVTVTVVGELAPPDRVMTLEEIFALRRPPYRSKEEIDDDIRRERDQWDE
jgi:hypothetical protein